MGGGKGSNKTTSQYQLPPEFIEAYKKSLGLAESAISKPYEAYSGQLVAGLTPTQQQAISNVNASQGVAQPYIQRGAGLTELASKGVTPELYQQFYSPYVRDVADNTFANLMESNAQQRSGLKSGAIQAGAFGGDRGGIAQAEMARQQNLATGQTMSGIYNQGYGQANQLAMQQAQNYGTMGQQLAGLGLNAQNAMLQGAQAQMAAGSQEQATNQAGLSALYDQWMQEKSYPFQLAQFFANISQGLGSTAGGTNTTTAPAPNPFSQLLGAGMTAAQIISDERAKENIEPVGQLNDGQTIYRFNYKGDPKTQIGLIAQEVETRRPDAVGEHNGLKAVDYHKATEDAASAGLGRAGFAEGGVPVMPYSRGVGYIPDGKLTAGSGNAIPTKHQEVPDTSLSKSFSELKPLSGDQVNGLRNVAADMGLYHSKPFYAAGGVARAHYEGGGGIAPEPFSLPKPEEVEAYIVEAAKSRGIDPEVALKVYRSEGATGDPAEAWQSKIVRKDGTREPSYGPFQLYTEGGLGNEMQNKTGLSPADPKNWKPSVDFGLDVAAKRGWSPWAGAKAIGLDPRAGLDGASAQSNYGRADEVIMPTADVAPTGIDMPASNSAPEKKFTGIFADDDTPSIVERIIGRRLSPEARSAVLNAGMAMMAGRSPFFLTNVGEAGRAGMETYYNALSNSRELAKQQADISRQGYEAKTGRMQVEVSERNAKRQQAALVLPIVRNLIALGQPVPPYLMNMIYDAFPEGSKERDEISATLPQGDGGGAGDMGVTQAPLSGPNVVDAAASPAVPAPGPQPVPAPDSTEPIVSSSSSDARKLMEGLPPSQNPYALMEDAQRAKIAGNPELYQSLTGEANKLLESYRKNGIPTPDGGIVPFPGAAEADARSKRVEGIGTGEGKIVSDYNAGVSDTMSSFAPRTIVVDGLKKSLATAETGKFAEFKADIVNAANSLGLASADQISEAEDLQTAMKYFAQGILDSGMKDKIGPQISNADLLLVAKGQGTVENLPVANRRIIGAMLGKLNYDKAKTAAFDEMVAEKGGIENLRSSDVRDFERNFAKENPVSKFVEAGIADTPVAGELSTPRNADYLKPGYKYVHPNGRVFMVKGYKDVNGKRQPVLEYVN